MASPNTLKIRAIGNRTIKITLNGKQVDKIIPAQR